MSHNSLPTDFVGAVLRDSVIFTVLFLVGHDMRGPSKSANLLLADPAEDYVVSHIQNSRRLLEPLAEIRLSMTIVSGCRLCSSLCFPSL